MASFAKVLSSERLKMSKTNMWILVIMSPIVSSLVGILSNIPEDHKSWGVLLMYMASVHAMLFLPILPGVFAAFICRYEHVGGGWKQILALPVKRSSLYIAKFTVVAGMLAVSQLLFTAVYLGIGFMRGFTAPIPWELIATSILGGWIATLPLAALQLTASLVWTSFAAPLALNVIFTLPNMLVANSERFAPYYPWVQPMLTMLSASSEDFGAFNLPLSQIMTIVVSSFVVFFVAGLVLIGRKEV
ncbi:ABC transporter permease [Paenibacillus sediminis]|uniref:ABC transporter permease n=1 Tax=Paenibacillus sediminis TaxID=664909 RepID=A0ABS4H321_9BACL|nr:ABC transporter permease [Paenibacillus sediminis]MBP1936930.1 hypothetical protein [Paenibacillus sediminis]